MNEEEFGALLRLARNELSNKQRALQSNFGLGNYPRWWFDQETGTLQFLDNTDRIRLVFNFVDVGSFSTRSRTWQWARSNDSVSAQLRHESATLEDLAVTTKLQVFARETSFEADEAMAWDFAALAVLHLSAIGCYRAPVSDGSLFVFLALKDLRSMN